MSYRWRLALALGGVILLVLSLLLLAYLLWPVAPILEQFQPAPTLFVPPQALSGVWSIG